jgi:hypothetical protein
MADVDVVPLLFIRFGQREAVAAARERDAGTQRS